MVGVERVTQKRCLEGLWGPWPADGMDDGFWLLLWKKWGAFGGFEAEETQSDLDFKGVISVLLKYALFRARNRILLLNLWAPREAIDNVGPT